MSILTTKGLLKQEETSVDRDHRFLFVFHCHLSSIFRFDVISATYTFCCRCSFHEYIAEIINDQFIFLFKLTVQSFGLANKILSGISFDATGARFQAISFISVKFYANCLHYK